ncbi:hypothetical protein CC86DRAFT_421336, partial [Ophiobolus disseminans]
HISVPPPAPPPRYVHFLSISTLRLPSSFVIGTVFPKTHRRLSSLLSGYNNGSNISAKASLSNFSISLGVMLESSASIAARNWDFMELSMRCESWLVTVGMMFVSIVSASWAWVCVSGGVGLVIVNKM